MLESILAPYSDWGLLILRVGLAICFLAHAWFKLDPDGPIKGPAGFAGFLKQMGVPLPLFFSWLYILLEGAGSVLLVLGLGTRLIAAGLLIGMIVAIIKVRIGMGKAKFSGAEGIGWEYEFILAVGALALVFTGAGMIGLDRFFGL
jgi:putative oxidoreductase